MNNYQQNDAGGVNLCAQYDKVECGTMTGVLLVTPDSNMSTSRCAFDVFSVRSVVKLFIVVTRVDRRLREVDGVVCVRQSVLRQ